MTTREDGGIEVPVTSAEPADSVLRDPDRTLIAYPIELTTPAPVVGETIEAYRERMRARYPWRTWPR